MNICIFENGVADAAIIDLTQIFSLPATTRFEFLKVRYALNAPPRTTHREGGAVKLPAGVNATLVVGLEIHVQLRTATKLFCGCALRCAAKTALALGCRVAPFTKWDRKSYWYPDLPKNYQISQYDLPVGVDGAIEVPRKDGSTTRVRIRRAHLEEDAGKNLHDDPGCTLVDLNRTGTPLLEIVTEPDIVSAEEAGALARELQRLVRYLGVAEADMQKGHMRFEPNINCIIEKGGAAVRTS